jgi:hypothetical protein
LSPSESISLSPSLSPSESISLSPSKSPSLSPSASLSPSTSPSPNIYDGVCWGHQFPESQEQPLSWQLWESSLGNPGQVQGNLEWGQIEVHFGTPLFSSVVDTGDSDSKELDAVVDKYNTGSGSVTIYIRGDSSLFGKFDELPAWEIYSVSIVKEWRWIQAKLEYLS